MNSKPKTRSHITSVVVTYFPDNKKLEALLDILCEQTARVIIVDNSHSGSLDKNLTKTHGNIDLLELGRNTGIAHALNVGIDKAIKLSKEPRSGYVALFDHDSLPENDMLERLLDSALKLQDQGVKLAAVGANYTDERGNGTSPFVKLEGLRLVREKCLPGALIPVEMLISSGSLVSMSAFKDIGPMRDELFIDYVDVEWSLRAGNLGYSLYGIVDARMEHELGDAPVDFFGRKIPVHSPLRDYYHIRNAVFLMKQPYASLAWKITDGYRTILKYFFYTLFVEPRFERWMKMNKGLLHGLINKLGQMP